MSIRSANTRVLAPLRAPGMSAARYSPADIQFWKHYIVSMRPYLCFVSGASGLLGMALVENTPTAHALIAVPVFFLSYGFGQALTDVFQTDTDSISSPYRPLVQGLIGKGWTLAISMVGLLCCSVVLGSLNSEALPVAATCVVGLITYTWFKRHWWGGPLWNSWIVAALPLIGFMVMGNSLSDATGNGTLQLAMLSAFCSYAVFVLLGYFKDISADKATGYRTFPVVFGWTSALVASAVFGAGALVSTWLLVLLRTGDVGSGTSLQVVVTWLLLAAGTIAMWRAHIAIASTRSEGQTYPGIMWSVRAHVALQLALVSLHSIFFTLIALACVPLLELALRMRPERTQV